MTNMPEETDNAPGERAEDGYDARLKKWAEERGLHHPGLTEDETFLADDYEGDDAISLSEDFDGLHVELSDGYGWRARFLITDLRAHCAKHGKITTWKDFEKLADVPREDVE